MTTQPALHDVERIRALLAPERAARRPIPAPDRPWFCVDVPHQGQPRLVRVYPPDGWCNAIDDGMPFDPDQIRAVRAMAGTDRELVGMPSGGERDERTQLALDRLAQGNLVSGERAIVAARRLATGGGWR